MPAAPRRRRASGCTTRSTSTSRSAAATCAVFPGDVLVGDGEGVVVIPRHLADEIAPAAAEQERIEAWILAEVKAGQGIFGLYPPDEATLERYRNSPAGRGPLS